MKEQAKPFISVVVPAFYEEDNIRKFYEELVGTLKTIDLKWELIFIDDGSQDGTWQEICKLYNNDKRVRGLKLSRNFGHQYSLIAGLSNSRGQVVITMDADLQHPPDIIPLLLEEWKKGVKIVHTIRIDNSNISWKKKISSRLFYKVFSFLSGVKLSSGMADFRLLDRQVVDEIISLKEGALFLRGLIEWLGYKSSKIEYTCRNRFHGSSKYNTWKMLSFAWTGITSFSIVPLRIGILLGLITSVFAILQLFDAVYTKLFTDESSEWASIVGIMSLLFAILFVFLGIIGEYIGRILMQVQNRPRFIISERIESEKTNEEENIIK
ncbi:MAG: glycosyltransferase [Planctomycetota bacterium]|jgi:dolichol-phosphate mannosyltransferase